MKAVQQVIRWQSPDGQLFKTKEETEENLDYKDKIQWIDEYRRRSIFTIAASNEEIYRLIRAFANRFQKI